MMPADSYGSLINHVASAYNGQGTDRMKMPAVRQLKALYKIYQSCAKLLLAKAMDAHTKSLGLLGCVTMICHIPSHVSQIYKYLTHPT